MKKRDLSRFELDTVEREAEDTVKEKLASLPVLALLRLNGQYTVETDVCHTRVGCALLQE